MNDAVERRVEEFVQEILGMIAAAGAEHRAAVLRAATEALADAGAPPSRWPSSRRASTPPTADASLRTGRGRPGRTPAASRPGAPLRGAEASL